MLLAVKADVAEVEIVEHVTYIGVQQAGSLFAMEVEVKVVIFYFLIRLFKVLLSLSDKLL